MKELNEMTIGRTDDPENPISVPAFEAAKVFGTGSRTHLGQQTWCRVNRPDTCSHSTRPSEFSSRLLHPRGRPHMHAETQCWRLPKDRGCNGGRGRKGNGKTARMSKRPQRA